MTENEKLIKSYADAIDCLKKNKPTSGFYMLQESVDMAIKALEEIQKYRAIGTVEKCLQNKDFLDFLADKMNPNDFEIYLRLYNALEEKGCDADGKN
jgi:hypothetical protein|nr:MAG TPA: hypothetical protein [Bacteriophage sp.]